MWHFTVYLAFAAPNLSAVGLVKLAWFSIVVPVDFRYIKYGARGSIMARMPKDGFIFDGEA